MIDGWETVALGDLLAQTNGLAYGIVQPGSHNLDGVPIVRVGDIARGVIDTTRPMKVAPEIDESHRRTRLRGGEVLLTIVGTVGRVAIVPATLKDWNVARAVAVIRARDDETAVWIKHVLGSPLLLQSMGIAQTDTVQATLNLRDVRLLRIPIPPLPELRRISNLLESLEQSIQTNIKIATSSSELCNAIWQGLMIKINRYTSLNGVANVVLGGTPSRAQKEYWGGDIPWINSGKVNEFRVIEASEMITEAGLLSSSTKMMPTGTTVIAITGATLGQVSRLEIAACGNQSVIGVYADETALNDYLFYYIKSKIDLLVQSATGGAQQHINKTNVEELSVGLPSDADIREWHSTAAPLLATIANSLFENQKLIRARDELLPLLLSGAIRVKEVAA